MKYLIFQFFFDWLFIVKLNIGMKGAAYANLLGSLVVTLIGLFFYSNKNREMCFTKPHKRIFQLHAQLCDQNSIWHVLPSLPGHFQRLPV